MKRASLGKLGEVGQLVEVHQVHPLLLARESGILGVEARVDSDVLENIEQVAVEHGIGSQEVEPREGRQALDARGGQGADLVALLAQGARDPVAVALGQGLVRRASAGEEPRDGRRRLAVPPLVGEEGSELDVGALVGRAVPEHKVVALAVPHPHRVGGHEDRLPVGHEELALGALGEVDVFAREGGDEGAEPPLRPLEGNADVDGLPDLAARLGAPLEEGGGLGRVPSGDPDYARALAHPFPQVEVGMLEEGLEDGAHEPLVCRAAQSHEVLGQAEHRREGLGPAGVEEQRAAPDEGEDGLDRPGFVALVDEEVEEGEHGLSMAEAGPLPGVADHGRGEGYAHPLALLEEQGDAAEGGRVPELLGTRGAGLDGED